LAVEEVLRRSVVDEDEMRLGLDSVHVYCRGLQTQSGKSSDRVVYGEL
jgi:hypothetical protein